MSPAGYATETATPLKMTEQHGTELDYLQTVADPWRITV